MTLIVPAQGEQTCTYFSFDRVPALRVSFSAESLVPLLAVLAHLEYAVELLVVHEDGLALPQNRRWQHHFVACARRLPSRRSRERKVALWLGPARRLCLCLAHLLELVLILIEWLWSDAVSEGHRLSEG